MSDNNEPMVRLRDLSVTFSGGRKERGSASADLEKQEARKQ